MVPVKSLSPGLPASTPPRPLPRPRRRSPQERWTVGWKALTQNRLWWLSLLAIGVLTSIVYPQPPLVALGALAGVTLTRPRAIGLMLVIWFVGQMYGFGLRGYPLTVDAVALGIMMGAGTLAVTGLASVRSDISCYSLRSHCWRLAAALISGFVVFQGLVMSLGWLLTGTNLFTWAILSQMFFKELVWTIALAANHVFLLQRQARLRSAVVRKR